MRLEKNEKSRQQSGLLTRPDKKDTIFTSGNETQEVEIYLKEAGYFFIEGSRLFFY